MTLHIYNTKTGKKEEFVPIEKEKIGMYVCGVTVYDNCHLGHARAAVVFDTIFKYLTYLKYSVSYVRNFTDIDDKIINRSKEEGIFWKELSEKYIKEYHNDMSRLNISCATYEPKATDHIDDMLNIIKILTDKGVAYESDGDVLYSVRKFPSYGHLSKRNIDEMIAGARIEPGGNKKDPLDFVLWKKSKPGEPFWDSPWGKGRPGWHIECSAMASRFLGKNFDIHGGGKDLIFPHHENEIAQSEAAFGFPPVNYWIHNGFVNINKEKMSKSLKNFFTIKEILEIYNPEVVRLFLLSTHYRNPLDFSDENLSETKEKLDRFYEMMQKVNYLLTVGTKEDNSLLPENNKTADELVQQLENKFTQIMNDDFNTAMAIGHIFLVVREINRYLLAISDIPPSSGISIFKNLKVQMQKIGNVLGLFTTDPEIYFKSGSFNILPDEINTLIAKRNEARKNKNWEESDKIRDNLLNNGIVLQDTKSGTQWKTIKK